MSKTGRMSFQTHITRLLIFIYIPTLCESSFMRWVPNTNLDNPGNWDSGQIPCANDRMHLPEITKSLFLKGNISTSELVLPINGELVLGNFASLTFPVQHSNEANCPGQDVRFNRTKSKNWFDPMNWCEAVSEDGPCLAKQPAKLDTENVPCRTDAVSFPKGSRFFVEIDAGVDITMKSLTVTGKVMDSNSFHQFLQSKDGKKQFKKNTSGPQSTVLIQAQECEDAGCICGNDEHHIQEKICENMKNSCDPVPCNKPLMTDGQCCNFCGGLLEMEYEPGFNFNNLYNILNLEFKRENRKGVEFIMSRTSSEKIVVVLKDDSGGENAADVAYTLAQKVHIDLQKFKKYGISDIRFQTSSEGGPSTGALSGGSGGLTGASIAGIILSIILLIIIVAVCMLCFVDKGHCRRRIPVLFARKKDEEPFGNDDVELTPSPSLNFKDIFFSTDMGRDRPSGFDNPMYAVQGDGPPSAPASKDKSEDGNANLDTDDATFVKQNVEDVGFSNPLYGSTKSDVCEYAHDQPLDNGTCDLIDMNSCNGFSNPLFMQNGKSEVTLDDSTLKFNPMYSDEGVEEDSTI